MPTNLPPKAVPATPAHRVAAVGVKTGTAAAGQKAPVLPAYKCTLVPATLSLHPGESGRLVVTLEGSAAIHLGDPGHTNRDLQVRLGVDPALIRIDNVTCLQPIQKQEFGWTKTTGEAKEYVINQRMSYPTGNDPIQGFDLQMGGLFGIEIKALKAGSAKIALLKCSLGAFDTSATLTGATVTIA